MILDGFKVAKKIRKKLIKDVLQLKKNNIFPKLVIIQVGNNISSSIYIKNKRIACQEVGIKLEEYNFDDSVNTNQLKKLITRLNQDNEVHGILIQHPLPKNLNEIEIFNMINPQKDVDGFTFDNIGKLYSTRNCFVPCTPKGIIRLLKEYQIPLVGKHVVIVGRSMIVGKPLALLFLQENATVTILHSKSINKEKIIESADILVSAVSIPKFITEKMVSKNAIVIDVGINYINGKIVGDVDFEKVSKKVKYITPVPKGIGPMTIAMLLENVIKACKENNKN